MDMSAARNKRGTNRRKWGLRLSSLMLAGLLLTPYAAPAAAADDSAAKAPAMNEVLDLLQRLHVSGTDQKALEASAIKGMIDSLGDPYTQYMTADEWNSFQSSLEQNYVGIGVRLEQDEQGYFIVEVFPGSSAAAAGLQPNDYIVAVDGKSYEGKALTDLTKAVMGEENTQVTITIKRGGAPQDVKMTRKRVELPTVDSKLFAGGIGYIKVDTFSSDADEKFAAQLEELEKSSLTALIVDLRGNPGGLLDTATNIAKKFIPEGVLIHTSDRNRVDQPIKLQGGGKVPFPVTVLVDSGSASASEVLTGALQDYGAARIVGTVTYGKGSVQTIYPITGGGMLKVTIEEYLTPKMRKVNKVGIKPDVEVEGAIPQTVKALRLSGASDVAVRQTKGGVTINDVAFFTPLPIVREGGRLFAPTRVLAALVDGDIAWNAELRAVDIKTPAVSASYAVGDSDVRMVNGVTYVALDAFATKFARFTWSDDGELATLRGAATGG